MCDTFAHSEVSVSAISSAIRYNIVQPARTLLRSWGQRSRGSPRMRLQGTSHPGRRGYGVRAGSSVARRLVRLTSRVELVRDAVAVRDLVQKINDASGKDLVIENDLSKPTIKTSLFLNWSKAVRELGWKPEISLEEGIEKTLNWYKENIK